MRAWGPWGHSSIPDRIDCDGWMEVNFFAAAELIREAYPLLRAGRHHDCQRQFGAGTSGRRAEERRLRQQVYVHGLSDALRAELTAAGIDVLLVSPSTTATEFFDTARSEQGALPVSAGE